MPAAPLTETDSMRKLALATSSRSSCSCAASSRTARTTPAAVLALRVEMQYISRRTKL